MGNNTNNVGALMSFTRKEVEIIIPEALVSNMYVLLIYFIAFLSKRIWSLSHYVLYLSPQNIQLCTFFMKHINTAYL